MKDKYWDKNILFCRLIKVESNPSYCICYFMRLIIHLSGDPSQQLVTIFCPGDTLWCPHKMINFSNDPEENNFQWFRSDHRHFGQIVDTVESKISLSGLMVWSKIGHRVDLCWKFESISELRCTWPSAVMWAVPDGDPVSVLYNIHITCIHS